jgi:hypothetical protein
MGLAHPILEIQILFPHLHENPDHLLDLFNFHQIFIFIQIHLKYLLQIEYFKGYQTCFVNFHSFLLFKKGLIINRIINH